MAINRTAIGIVWQQRLPPIWEVIGESALLGLAFGAVVGLFIWYRRESEYNRQAGSGQ